MKALTGKNVPVQVLVATHSPLTGLAEPSFDPAGCGLLRSAARRAGGDRAGPWAKQGDVVNWLVSDAFGLQPKPGNTILGAKIRHLWGRETLTASCGLQFEVSPYSFFQVHKEQAEILYEKALAYADLKGGENRHRRLLRHSTISSAWYGAKRVIGIEIVKPAIEDAKKNAKKNHMENTEFYAADAENHAAALPARTGS